MHSRRCHWKLESAGSQNHNGLTKTSDAAIRRLLLLWPDSWKNPNKILGAKVHEAQRPRLCFGMRLFLVPSFSTTCQSLTRILLRHLQRIKMRWGHAVSCFTHGQNYSWRAFDLPCSSVSASYSGCFRNKGEFITVALGERKGSAHVVDIDSSCPLALIRLWIDIIGSRCYLPFVSPFYIFVGESIFAGCSTDVSRSVRFMESQRRNTRAPQFSHDLR